MSALFFALVVFATALVVDTVPEAAWSNETAIVVLVGMATLTGVAACSRRPPLKRSPFRAAFDHWDLALLLLAACSLFSLIRHGGVPSFRQDWLIPELGADFSAYMLESLRAWRESGVGEASAQAGVYPAFLIPAALAALFGSHVAIVSILVLVTAGTAVVSRRAISVVTGASMVESAPAAAFYSFGPLALNRIVAGHWMHSWFHFVFAAVTLLLLELPTNKFHERALRVLGTIALVASTAPQPHALVISLTLAVIVLLSKRQLRTAVFISVSVTVLILPTLAASRLASADIFVARRAVLEWELAQSVEPRLLLHLGGYIARYSDALSTPMATFAAGLIVATLAFAPIVMSRRAATFAFAGVLCAFVVAGLRGPLAGPLTLGFERLPPLSIIRELYDVVPPFAFAASCSFAAVLCRMNFLLVRPGVAVGGMTLAIIAAWATVTGDVWRLVAISSDNQAARQISSLPGDERILYLPGIYPLAASNGIGEGLDPLALQYGRHPAISVLQPIPAVARAYWLLSRDPDSAAEWLRKIGCGWIILDNARRVGNNNEPAEANLERGARKIGQLWRSTKAMTVYRLRTSASKIASVAVRVRSGVVENDHNADTVDLLIDDPANADVLRNAINMNIRWSLVAPSNTIADPTRALVLAWTPWQRIPPLADVPGTAVVGGIGIAVKFRPGVLAGSWLGSASQIGIASRHVDARVGITPVDFPRSFVVIGTRTGPTTFDDVIAHAGKSLTWSRSARDSYAITAPDANKGVTFRERYDPGWILRDEAGRPQLHFRADGWSNAWLTQARRSQRYNLTYEPSRIIYVLEYVAATAWALILALCIALLRYHDRGRGPTQPCVTGLTASA